MRIQDIKTIREAGDVDLYDITVISGGGINATAHKITVNPETVFLPGSRIHLKTE
jgi:hypothetical protein